MTNPADIIRALNSHPAPDTKLDATPAPPPWKDWQVFGNANERHRECCQCCTVYCPGGDTGLFTDAFEGLMCTLDLHGTRYISDVYIAVRADLVNTEHEPRGIEIKKEGIERVFQIPDTEPPASSRTFDPARLYALTNIGVDIREGNEGSTQQLLYLAGEHIGWVAPTVTEPGGYRVTIDAIPEISKIADTLPVKVNDHPWNTAVKLLQWELDRATEDRK